MILGLCLLTRYGVAGVQASRMPVANSDKELQDAAQKALERNSALTSVQVSVSHGAVTLSGIVDHYDDKLNAESTIRELPGARRVESEIELTTASVPDTELKRRLEDRIHIG